MHDRHGYRREATTMWSAGDGATTTMGLPEATTRTEAVATTVGRTPSTNWRKPETSRCYTWPSTSKPYDATKLGAVKAET